MPLIDSEKPCPHCGARLTARTLQRSRVDRRLVYHCPQCATQLRFGLKDRRWIWLCIPSLIFLLPMEMLLPVDQRPAVLPYLAGFGIASGILLILGLAWAQRSLVLRKAT